jgi:hypothetical protein
MKIKKTKILPCSWLHTGTYDKNLADLGKFFYGKSFVQVKIIFFWLKFGEISPIKKTQVGAIRLLCAKGK